MLEKFSLLASKAGVLLKKNSPRLLIAGGIICIGAGTFLACRATLKVHDKMDEGKKKLNDLKIKRASSDEKTYPEKEYKKDLATQYIKNGVDIVVEYAPGLGLTAAGVGCFIAAWRIENLRYLGAVAAYNGLQDTFIKYRRNVRNDQGEEKDREYLEKTIDTVEVVSMNEDGTTSIEVEGVNCSPYARFFDSSSVAWTKSPELNMSYCIAQQNAANDLLQLHGHLFLNEVYDMLGIPRSQAGAVVGWVLGNGDSYVDFGILDPTDEKKRDFINGYENVILLDFNVDGVIYDKI